MDVKTRTKYIKLLFEISSNSSLEQYHLNKVQSKIRYFEEKKQREEKRAASQEKRKEESGKASQPDRTN